jgi:ribosomal protein L40E
MNRMEPNPTPRLTCRDCGAANWPMARECWLCHRRDWKPREIAAPTGRAAPDDKPRPPTGDRANRTATVVASVVSATLISVAVFFFVTVVLPFVAFCVVVVSLMIALYQFCSALGGHPH